MKKLVITLIIILLIVISIVYVYNRKIKATTNSLEKMITEEMAYEGVSKYCKDTYNWSMEDSSMYLKMGDETETEYQAIFRSYTGAFVYFYVNKVSGITRLVEYSPILNIESEAGTINLFDYLDKNNETI